MSNQPFIDINGSTSYRKAKGDGTIANPFIPEFSEPYFNGSGSLVVSTTFGGATPSTGFIINTLDDNTGKRIGHIKRLSVQVNNVGAVALNAFEVATRISSSSVFIPKLNTASHFTTVPFSSLIGSGVSILSGSADSSGVAFSPVTLPSSGLVVLDFDFSSFFVEAIRFQATVASGTTQLDFTWGCA